MLVTIIIIYQIIIKGIGLLLAGSITLHLLGDMIQDKPGTQSIIFSLQMNNISRSYFLQLKGGLRLMFVH